jgi:hypothetical protein
MVQRAFTPNMAGGLTSIRSPQSILCLIFFPDRKEYHFTIIRKKIFFSEAGRKMFFPKWGGRQYTNRKRYRGTIKVLRRQTAAA